MTDDDKSEIPEDTEEKEESVSEESDEEAATVDELKKSLEEANNKYIRLYADFDNYKKISARNKEELLKYANKDLITDILTVIDHLELALQHTSDDKASNSLAEGVQLTLKELRTVLEKHGLIPIDALGKHFDPSVHHAMSQIESDDAEENTVIKEFRKGYMLKERVIRASLVGVAIKPAQSEDSEPENKKNETVTTDE